MKKFLAILTFFTVLSCSQTAPVEFTNLESVNITRGDSLIVDTCKVDTLKLKLVKFQRNLAVKKENIKQI